MLKTLSIFVFFTAWIAANTFGKSFPPGIADSISQRLAPPGSFPGRKLFGKFPDQDNDVHLAEELPWNDPRPNGQVGTAGGSAVATRVALAVAATGRASFTLLPYPKGIWAAYGQAADLPPELINDLGVVGLGISEDWSVVNPAPGVYDWTSLDNKIAQAKAAGFKINLIITNSSDKTPTWLLDDSLPVNPVRIDLIDPSPQHTAYCSPVHTCLYWDPVFHQARLDLIAAAGAHYNSDPEIIAVTMGFANQHSNDFNVLDNVFTVDNPLVCPMCPTTPPQLCGRLTNIDQPAQWLAAGWTEQELVQVGEELADAYAAAFPNQYIKMPIGGMNDTLMDKPGVLGTYSTLARDMEDYVYGNPTLGIPARPYANRFYLQRNTLNADWVSATTYDPPNNPPGFDGDPYIRYMIRKHAAPTDVGGLTPGQAGIQLVEAATGHLNGCRQAGGVLTCNNGSCPAGDDPAFDSCVMQASLDEARTFGTDFIEIWAQDAQNPAFYSMITAATVAMGGTPRTSGAPTPTPTPTATPTTTPTPTPSATPTPTATPTTTPTPTPSATPTPTATPSPTPPPQYLLNISTRVKVRSGQGALIGGFIISGHTPKNVVMRALGPSLAPLGVLHPLGDPVLTLYNSAGTLIGQNDNWTSLPASTVPVELQPSNPAESVIVTTLVPGNYTAVLSGVGGTIGNALYELYDLQPGNSSVRNISTRGQVGTDGDVMIGGFIIGGTAPAKVIIRAIGPSLVPFGLTGALADPILELHNQDGSLIYQNDNWRDEQAQQIIDSTVPPSDERESAIVASLPPGVYTAIVRGADNSTGIALVEVYALDP